METVIWAMELPQTSFPHLNEPLSADLQGRDFSCIEEATRRQLPSSPLSMVCDKLSVENPSAVGIQSDIFPCPETYDKITDTESISRARKNDFSPVNEQHRSELECGDSGGAVKGIRETVSNDCTVKGLALEFATVHSKNEHASDSFSSSIRFYQKCNSSTLPEDRMMQSQHAVCSQSTDSCFTPATSAEVGHNIRLENNAHASTMYTVQSTENGLKSERIKKDSSCPSPSSCEIPANDMVASKPAEISSDYFPLLTNGCGVVEENNIVSNEKGVNGKIAVENGVLGVSKEFKIETADALNSVKDTDFSDSQPNGVNTKRKQNCTASSTKAALLTTKHEPTGDRSAFSGKRESQSKSYMASFQAFAVQGRENKAESQNSDNKCTANFAKPVDDVTRISSVITSSKNFKHETDEDISSLIQEHNLSIATNINNAIAVMADDTVTQSDHVSSNTGDGVSSCEVLTSKNNMSTIAVSSLVMTSTDDFIAPFRGHIHHIPETDEDDVKTAEGSSKPPSSTAARMQLITRVGCLVPLPPPRARRNSRAGSTSYSLRSAKVSTERKTEISVVGAVDDVEDLKLSKSKRSRERDGVIEGGLDGGASTASAVGSSAAVLPRRRAVKRSRSKTSQESLGSDLSTTACPGLSASADQTSEMTTSEGDYTTEPHTKLSTTTPSITPATITSGLVPSISSITTSSAKQPTVTTAPKKPRRKPSPRVKTGDSINRVSVATDLNINPTSTTELSSTTTEDGERDGEEGRKSLEVGEGVMGEVTRAEDDGSVLAVSSLYPPPPKKPLSPYMRFSKSIWVADSKEFQTMSVCEVGSNIGRMWRELDEITKKKFNDSYAIDKLRYDKDMAAYLRRTGLSRSNVPRIKSVRQRSSSHRPRKPKTSTPPAAPDSSPPTPSSSTAPGTTSPDSSTLTNEQVAEQMARSFLESAGISHSDLIYGGGGGAVGTGGTEGGTEGVTYQTLADPSSNQYYQWAVPEMYGHNGQPFTVADMYAGTTGLDGSGQSGQTGGVDMATLYSNAVSHLSCAVTSSHNQMSNDPHSTIDSTWFWNQFNSGTVTTTGLADQYSMTAGLDNTSTTMSGHQNTTQYVDSVLAAAASMLTSDGEVSENTNAASMLQSAGESGLTVYRLSADGTSFEASSACYHEGGGDHASVGGMVLDAGEVTRAVESSGHSTANSGTLYQVDQLYAEGGGSVTNWGTTESAVAGPDVISDIEKQQLRNALTEKSRECERLLAELQHTYLLVHQLKQQNDIYQRHWTMTSESLAAVQMMNSGSLTAAQLTADGACREYATNVVDPSTEYTVVDGVDILCGASAVMEGGVVQSGENTGGDDTVGLGYGVVSDGNIEQQ